MSDNWSKFTDIRLVDGKVKKVFVDIFGDIINKNPEKEELKRVKPYPGTAYVDIKRLPEDEKIKYILEFLRYFYHKKGRVPMILDFNNNIRFPSFNVYIWIFGSWDIALEKSGLLKLRIPGQQKYNKQKVIESLQNFYIKEGRSPKTSDFSNNPNYPGYATVIEMFEGWNNALIEAGLDIQIKYTKDILIEKMHQFEIENGRPPVQQDFYHNPKYPSFTVFNRTFGSWNNAKLAAGYDIDCSNTRGRLGEEQTLSEFKTEGATDLSGDNHHNSCDGICPKGELYEVKSRSLIHFPNCPEFDYWSFKVTRQQLKNAKYVFLRAYETNNFTKPPKYKWRIPIDLFECRTGINIYKDDNRGTLNVRTMKKYEY